MTQLDRVPSKKLEERYGIVRSALYTRISALKIKPKRVGNRAFVTKEQLQLLDDLHAHIQAGGTTAEFLEANGIPRGPARNGQGSSNGSQEEPAGAALALSKLQSETIMKLVAKITSRLELATQRDPLGYFDSLEKAYKNRWLLSTSELSELLSLSSGTIRGYGESFKEAGFVFTRSGTRARGGMAWKVSKLD